MDWFSAAVISAVGLSAQALVFQRLQRHYAINTFMAYAWLGAAFEVLRLGGIVLIVAGVLTVSGAWQMSGKDFSIAYAIAIDNSRIIILYLVGLAMFGTSWGRAQAAGIVLTFVGILLLA